MTMIDDFYMADSFNRVDGMAYCTANAISNSSKNCTLLNNADSTISWTPMAIVTSVDSLSDKLAEMAKSIEELKKSFEALNSKPLRKLRSQLCTLNTERYK